MRKFYVIIAKSGSGKDSLYHRLRNMPDLCLNTFVLYYTRPMRVGEVNGETYRFISNDEMTTLKKGKNVIATEYYDTNYGGCEIALVEDDQIEKEGNYLCVMSLKFYVAMEEYFKNREDVELVPIYIDVPAKDRLERSMKREEQEANPNYKEILRRFIADEVDFSEEVLARIPICNRFTNDNLDRFVDEVVEMIRSKNVSTTNSLTKGDLKKLLLEVNKGGKQSNNAKNHIIAEFRKNDAYEEYLFDVLSYCESGKLLEEYQETGEFTFDDMLDTLYNDMLSTNKTKLKVDYVARNVLTNVVYDVLKYTCDNYYLCEEFIQSVVKNAYVVDDNQKLVVYDNTGKEKLMEVKENDYILINSEFGLYTTRSEKNFKGHFEILK